MLLFTACPIPPLKNAETRELPQSILGPLSCYTSL